MRRSQQLQQRSAIPATVVKVQRRQRGELFDCCALLQRGAIRKAEVAEQRQLDQWRQIQIRRKGMQLQRAKGRQHRQRIHH